MLLSLLVALAFATTTYAGDPPTPRQTPDSIEIADDEDEPEDEDEDRDEEDEGDEDDEDEFAEWDRNGDGVVSRDETDMPAREFKQIDRDGDKKLTRDELERFYLEEQVSEIFVEQDKDLSGTLSRDELDEEFREEFARIDANKDGQISGKELLRFFEEERREEAEGDEEAEDAGAIVIKALKEAGKDLDAAAFPGSKRLFKAIDRNGDGKLSLEEATSYRRQGLTLMERLWELEERASEAELPRKDWELLFREAEACFQAGRYADLPALCKELAKRVKAASKRSKQMRKRKRMDREGDE